MGINLLWTKNMGQKEKEAFETLLRNNTIIVRRLLEILAERKEEYERREISKTEYDNPSWAYKQAHTNGAKTELKFIESLFKLNEGEAR